MGATFRPKQANNDSWIYHLKTSTSSCKFLGFNSGYHSRQEEIEKAREEAAVSMAKKIANLQQQNEEKKLREYSLRNNLNVGTVFPNF